mgnify:CR=1 FL=1
MNLDDKITNKIANYKELKLDIITDIAEKLYNKIDNELFTVIADSTIKVTIGTNHLMDDYFIKYSFYQLDKAVVNVLGDNYSLESVTRDTCFNIVLLIKKSN